MTENTNTETAKAPKKPSHTAYSIREREGKDAQFRHECNRLGHGSPGRAE